MKELKGIEDIEVIKPLLREDLDVEVLRSEYNMKMSRMADLQHQVMDMHFKKDDPAIDAKIENELNPEIKALNERCKEILAIMENREVKQYEGFLQDESVHELADKNFRSN